MKKTALFLAALALASCSKEADDMNFSAKETAGIPIVFSAGMDSDQTKSHFGEGASFDKLYWDESDKLGIYYKESTGKKWATYEIADFKENQYMATFTGGHKWASESDHSFFAFYPCNDKNTYTDNTLPNSVAFKLADNQTLTSYSDLHLCAATVSYSGEVTDTDAAVQPEFEFHPLMTYLQLKLYTDYDLSDGSRLYLSQLSIYSNSTPLAGNYVVNLSVLDKYLQGNGETTKKSELFPTLGDAMSINLTLADASQGRVNGIELTADNKDKETGIPVYAVMLPADLTGKALRFQGVATLQTPDNRFISHSIELIAKKGIDYACGMGYTISLNIKPDIDVSIPNDAPRLARINNVWYNYDELIEQMKTNPDDLLPGNQGTSLYITQQTIDGETPTYTDQDAADIKKLLDLIYERSGENVRTPITLDMSDANWDGEFGEQAATAPHFGEPYPKALESLILPATLTKIQAGMFAGCTSLINVTLPANGILEVIGGQAFKGCTALTSIVIPNSVTTISANAFQGCTNLTYVKLPDGIEKIDGSEAFSDTGIKEIILPKTLIKVSTSCFQNCANLADIYCYRYEPSAEETVITVIGGDTFKGSGSEVEKKTLHVVNGAENTYKTETTYKWSNTIGKYGYEISGDL